MLRISNSLSLPLQLCALLLLTLISSANADEITPNSNLTGIDKIHEHIPIGLELKGAEAFNVNPEKVKQILLDAIKGAGVTTTNSGTETPTITLSIFGESTGGGGARYTVDLKVHGLIASPYAKDRTFDVIIWQTSISDEQFERYDPAAKDLIKPNSALDERVYTSVQEVAQRLVKAFRDAK